MQFWAFSALVSNKIRTKRIIIGDIPPSEIAKLSAQIAKNKAKSPNTHSNTVFYFPEDKTRNLFIYPIRDNKRNFGF